MTNAIKNEALDSIHSTTFRLLGQISSCSSLRGSAAWLPRYLQPTESGDYYPLNTYEFRIGCNSPTKCLKAWIIPSEALDLTGLAIMPDGWIDLFQGSLPWSNESDKGAYLSTLIQVFRIPTSLVRKARPAVKSSIVLVA